MAPKNKPQEAVAAADHSAAPSIPTTGKIKVRIRPNNSLTVRAPHGVSRYKQAGEWIEIDAADLAHMAGAVETEDQAAESDQKALAELEAAEAVGDDPMFLKLRESYSNQQKARKEADAAFAKMQLGMPRDEAFEAVRAEQRKKF